MYAFCTTNSSESPSTRIAFLHKINLRVSYPAILLKNSAESNFAILTILWLSNNNKFSSPNLFATKLLWVDMIICLLPYLLSIDEINWFNLEKDKWLSGSSNKIILAFCTCLCVKANSVFITHCAPFPTYPKGILFNWVTRLFSHAFFVPKSTDNETSPSIIEDSLLILSLIAWIEGSSINSSRIFLCAWATDVTSSGESKSLTIREI